ncbi:molybdopterin-dependent oxidoreductase [Actinoallomurus soli]|uniref:molybdopterin-dependent oxidoreductase n=1 Tax=Actinoallomurus soli TaxID=2952535 RepID=UPI0020938700|nr:molybdopterin-dependent oxidoreductase [Actinoallomurus soli]MCO5970770.1 molybdopterin-dependent oxidoreductase [Actinoallomurus soli]
MSGEGTPVGRRVVLGMAGLGAVGVVIGARVQSGVSRAFGPVGSRVTGLIPAAGGFRFYSVVDSVRRVAPADYRLTVGGLVDHPRTFRFADLQALPQTRMTDTFHCVTGWTVPDVAWAGVALPDLLDVVGVRPGARGVRFTSFDGAYTDTLTLEQARRRDVIVATSMLGGPVSHEHGGPVRMYVAPMYGYKSTKWLGGIDLVDRVEPGYWETRGYDVDGWIGRSNGYTS